MINKKNIISFNTIIRKEVTRFVRIWKQTLLPSVITISLYFLIFGTFIGSQIRKIEGFDYISFIVPGLIMMAGINNSFSNVVASFYMARFQKSIEELLISPTPNYLIILGYSIGGMLRGLLVGILVTIVSLFFTELYIYNILIVFVFLILTSFVFSLAGITNGIFARNFDDISIIPTFVLTPLIYLGGVFYSISYLSPFWQSVSKFNPILYMINGFRYGFLGITDVNIYLAFIMIAAFAGILFGTNLYLLKKGIGLKD